jgi:hypothetical protein
MLPQSSDHSCTLRMEAADSFETVVLSKYTVLHPRRQCFSDFEMILVYCQFFPTVVMIRTFYSRSVL